ncbi:MAG TPA: BTAD domain-containing putative transcriptional regulator [Gemmatimonadota bacterium]|nr:BTAD domain-containing putative transcriptional regulator [Gemmatimonadota bacterium]
MLEFRILGPLDLRDPANGDLQAILARPKQVALLAYLTLAGGLRHRDELLGVFWPETSQARGRRALSQALYRLRRSLGDEVIVSRGSEEVGIDAERLWCDAVEFDRRLVDGNRAGALELYRGDLLNGLHLDDAPAFEEWLTAERERLMARALESARELADELAAAGEGIEAAYWLRRALRWEPYDEELLRRLLTLLAKLGDRAGVIREYEAFARRYADDLALEPEAATRAIVERARTETGEAAVALDEVDQKWGKRDPSAAGAPVAEMPTEIGRTKRASRWRAAAASAAVVILAIAVLVGNRQSEPATAGSAEPEVAEALDPRRIVLLPFDNRTGDPSLDPLGSLTADWIAQELSRTGLVRPVLPIAAIDSLRLGKDAPTSIRPADLEDATRLEAGHLIAGWYTADRDSLFFHAQIARVPTGEIVQIIERIAAPASDPSVAVERLRQRATGALAALLDPDLRSGATPAASQPPSFQAYRDYAKGVELFHRREYRLASEAFHRAATHDSTFTAPLAWAVRSHEAAIYYPNQARRDALESARADSVLGYLQARLDRLPPWESAMVEYLGGRMGADPQGAYDALKRLVDMTPDPMWVRSLAAMTMGRNRPREALEILLSLPPDLPYPEDWNRLYLQMRMNLHHVLGEYGKEWQVYQQFRARYPPEWPVPPVSVPHELYGIRSLAALGRAADLERALDDLAEKESGLHFIEAREAKLHGHREIARRSLERDLTWIRQQPPDDDPEELWRWDIAGALYHLGRHEEARPHYEALLLAARPESDNRILFLGALGAIAAHRGDRAEALRYDRLLAEFDVSIGEAWWKRAVNLERAEIAAALGDRRRALTLLAEEIEAGLPLYGNMHPEMFHQEFEALRGHPAYEALTRPR